MTSVRVRLSNNDEASEQVPYGKGCIECRDVMKKGCPYLVFDGIYDSCRESPSFKTQARGIVEEHKSNACSPLSTNDQVGTGQEVGSLFAAVYDGLTRSEFEDANEGFSPEQLRVPPTLKTHPETKEEVEVFVVPGKAASFRLEVFELFAAKHGVNAMPVSIYKKQGSDTFTWHSDIARKRPRI